MRTWAEIDLNALEHNMKEIRRITDPKAKIMAIVKADAYGHGFYETAKALAQNGADCFAVAVIEEGVQLRRAGFCQPILILGGVDDTAVEQAVAFDIMMTVFSYDFAEEISQEAVKQGKKAKIHIKLDTGMSRIGYIVGCKDSAVVEEILKISQLPGIIIDGIFSHFSTSDETNTEYTHLQFDRFMKVCGALEERGLHIPVKHIANSAAIIMYPETHLDMVRPGIILYGLYPSEEVDRSRLALQPVMTLKSKITMVKELEAGRGVSYGKEYITAGTIKIATVPVGYADGYLRGLAKKGKMIVNGKIVPVVGRICMDQCMIDVTTVHNISKGDEVTLFTNQSVTADDLAHWLGTINYEIVCMISKRIPRVYIKNGKAVKELNYIL